LYSSANPPNKKYSRLYSFVKLRYHHTTPTNPQKLKIKYQNGKLQIKVQKYTKKNNK